MTDVLASPGAPDPRIAWANEARKVVTRADALNDDGSLNQQFFKPKKVVFATEKVKWSNENWESLYKVGLCTI
jgi:5'(3')-deoxyribonucleotidase